MNESVCVCGVKFSRLSGNIHHLAGQLVPLLLYKIFPQHIIYCKLTHTQTQMKVQRRQDSGFVVDIGVLLHIKDLLHRKPIIFDEKLPEVLYSVSYSICR